MASDNLTGAGPIKIEDASRAALGENLLSDESALRAEYRNRNTPYQFKSCHPADEAAHVQNGWEVHKRNKTSVRLKRLKPHGHLLEDKTWCLFYRMRYPILNKRQFRLTYTRPDGTSDTKQLDVVAKDDETVVVIECKSRQERGRRYLSKDLKETEALQKPIANAVRNLFGAKPSLKIIWIYVTEKIIWSEGDVERAGSINVRVMTENEFAYYDAFVRHIGPAGRYQFLAEMLRGQKIPGLENTIVPAVKGSLGGHTFYSFVTTPRHLLKIAYVNHLALNHPDGQPAYQRMISKSRIKAIGSFIEKGGYFPTNLIVNFVESVRFDLLSNKENVHEDLRFGWLHLPNKYKSAWVVDGQHRLYGFSDLNEKLLDNSIFVLAFDRMDTVTEADLFTTINSKQKSVPRSILVALTADLKWGSNEPKERIEALSSALVKAINVDPTSPLFRRFAIEGLQPEETTALTVAEVVKGLVKSGLLGKVIHGNHVPGPLSGATDPDTLVRARRFLNLYFGRLREASPPRWELGRQGNILSNPSMRAHLLLVAEICKYLEHKQGIEPHAKTPEQLIEAVAPTLAPVIAEIKNSTEAQISEKYARQFGEGGVTNYFYGLCTAIYEQRSDFGTDELKAYIAARKDARINSTNQDIIQLNKEISDHIFEVLKKAHGTHELKSGEKAYWDIGIESAQAKENAYKRQQEEPPENRLPKEAYVDLLDLMKIVRQKSNWPLFEKTMSIQMPDEKKGKTYYLEWMETFNKLRRIPAHSSSLRVYEESDYEFITWLKHEFYARLTQYRQSNAA